MKSVCVYCGSSGGKNPIYLDSAYSFGKKLALEDLTLVYGGGNVGLMGAVANGALESSGQVVGVITNFLWEKERGHRGLTELQKVGTMHERKERMYRLSDAFVAMPGGFGTLDELCEILTWQQLGHHDKPIALFNINGYFDLIIQQFQHFADEGFLKQQQLDNILVESDPDILIKKMREHKPVILEKWIEPDKPGFSEI